MNGTASRANARAAARRKRNFTILQQGGLAKLEKSVLEGFILEVNVRKIYNAFTAPSSRLMSKVDRFLSFSQSRRPNDLKWEKILAQRLRDAEGKRKGTHTTQAAWEAARESSRSRERLHKQPCKGEQLKTGNPTHAVSPTGQDERERTRQRAETRSGDANPEF